MKPQYDINFFQIKALTLLSITYMLTSYHESYNNQPDKNGTPYESETSSQSVIYMYHALQGIYDKLSAKGHTSVSRLSQKSGQILVHPRNLGKVAY